MTELHTPPELVRCQTCGLQLIEGNMPHLSECVSCQLEVEFGETTPDGELSDLEFRNRIEWETFQDLIPFMKSYLDESEDDPEFWVTHIKWNRDLPAGYTEQERGVVILGYRWGAMNKYITTNKNAKETIKSLLKNGYGE